jgi:hypothetical protein
LFIFLTRALNSFFALAIFSSSSAGNPPARLSYYNVKKEVTHFSLSLRGVGVLGGARRGEAEEFGGGSNELATDFGVSDRAVVIIDYDLEEGVAEVRDDLLGEVIGGLQGPQLLPNGSENLALGGHDAVLRRVVEVSTNALSE